MSSLLPPYPDSINSLNLQIWNNAAFEDSGGDAVADAPPTNAISWLPLQPISVNCCRSPDKENQAFPKSPVPSALKPSGPFSLTPYPGKASAKVKFRLETDATDEEDREIDLEIESIQREIGRLRARLDVLRNKKAERDSRAAGDGRRGRMVPARFLDPTQRSCKKLEESPAQRKAENAPASTKARKRGVSLGPSEIRGVLRKLPESLPPSRTPVPSAAKTTQALSAGRTTTTTVNTKKPVEFTPSARSGRVVEVGRRGLSLGPVEIVLSATSRQIGGFRKLQNLIRDERAEGNRSQSVSPKSKKPAVDFRRGLATVGTKKTIKKEVETHSLEPKTLFHDDNDQEQQNKLAADVPKKSQPRRTQRSRIVASRYSLIDTRAYSENKRRKWSMPEKDGEQSGVKDSVKRSRVSLPVTAGQGKKHKEGASLVEAGIAKEPVGTAPAEVCTPAPFSATGRLPKIRTFRNGVAETPRDSGPAKRVADLIGRRTHFGHRISGTPPADDACFQSLDFEDAVKGGEADDEVEQVP